MSLESQGAPVEEHAQETGAPSEYQKTIIIPGGGEQIIDTRLVYRWEPATDQTPGRLVADAAYQDIEIAIPEQFRKTIVVEGREQVVDTRLVYRWEPATDQTPGRLVADAVAMV